MNEQIAEKVRAAQMWGANLKRLRKNRNIKLVELADKTGIPKAEISKFENNGRVTINPDKMVLVCEALGITPNDLFGY